MKIQISYPPLPNNKGVPMLSQNRQFQWFSESTYIYPVVPAYAATLLKNAGYDVLWDDGIAEEKTYERWLADLERVSPDVMMIETKTPVVKRHWKIIGDVKKILPDVKIVLVGDHVTALPSESMERSQVDFVLTGGDFDFLLLNLVEYLDGRHRDLEPGIWLRKNGGIKNTGRFELKHDLDSLPFIDRDLTRWQLYAYKNGNYKRTPGTYTMTGRDCVTWDTDILLKVNGRFRFVKMGEFIDRVFDENGYRIEYQGITEVLRVQNIKVFGFDPVSLRVKLFDVAELIRKPSPASLLYIRTESGRVIKVTETHPMFVLEDGSIVEKLAKQLMIGDYCVVPLRSRVSCGVREVDFIEEVSRLSLEEQAKYRVAGVEVKKVLYSKKLGFWMSLLGIKGYKRNPRDCIVGRWRRSGRIPIHAFMKIEKLLDINIDRKNLMMVARGCKDPIPAIVRVNNELARLLGYILSDGHVSETKAHCYFDLDEEDLIQDFRRCVGSTLGIDTHTSVRKDKLGRPSWVEVCAPNSTLAKMLKGIFQIPSRKSIARIPPILFEASDDVATHFLAAYIAGDGSGVRDSVLIRSVSENLVNGICYLLIKCGIPFHVRRCKKQKPNHSVPLEISITRNFVERVSNISIIGRKREEQVKAIQWNSEGPLYSRLMPVNHLNLKSIVRENSDKIPLGVKRLFYAKERISIDTFKRLLNYVQAESLRKILSGDIRFDRVVEIKEINSDKPYVYDLYIPEASSFLAGFGGIVTHNCWYRRNGGCTFCSWPVLYPSFRVRSPESLVDEIEMLVAKYRVREVFDDTGTFPVGEWLRKFCSLMIERGLNEMVYFSCNMRFGALSLEDYTLMKRAGFRMLLFGLESASQRILDEINKGLTVEEMVDSCRKAKKAGLDVHITVMFGYPTASREEELQTYRLARKLIEDGCADTLQSTLLMPYPGSKLYETALEKGWLRYSPGEWEHWDMSEPVMKSLDMSPREVKELCDETYKLFLSPKYALRRMLSIRSFEDLKFSFRGARKVIGHIKDFK